MLPTETREGLLGKETVLRVLTKDQLEGEREEVRHMRFESPPPPSRVRRLINNLISKYGRAGWNNLPLRRKKPNTLTGILW